ncbi:MAG: hypothetical protein AAB250_18545 [Bdellovibrionota bacterium]
MKTILYAALLALAASLTNTAHAAVCFNDVPSWETVKDQLPEFMQDEAFYATHESSMMLGAFAVEQVEEIFRLEGHGRHVLAGTFHESDTVTEVCVEGAKIKVSLEGGGGDTITQVSGGLKIRGYKFKFTTKEAYEEVVDRVPRRSTIRLRSLWVEEDL